MGKNMLVVSAHGADWCTRSGGTILKYIEKGYRVKILALTFGERGESGAYWKAKPNSTVQACKDCRKGEAQAAADFIGAEIEFYDFDDYPLQMDVERIRVLIYKILEFRPDIVLTHWIDDPMNVDHEVTGKAVTRAISCAGMLGALPNTPNHFIPDVFFFETTIPLPEFNHFIPDTYIDIGNVIDKKLEAVACFKAQPQLINMYRNCALNRGQQANDWSRGRRSIEYAEAFKRWNPYL